MRRVEVQGQPRKIVMRPISRITRAKWTAVCHSSGRAPTLQVQSSNPNPTKKKIKLLYIIAVIVSLDKLVAVELLTISI
jgi:hypothetical protein